MSAGNPDFKAEGLGSIPNVTSQKDQALNPQPEGSFLSFTFVLTQQTGYILRLINHFFLEDTRHSYL